MAADDEDEDSVDQIHCVWCELGFEPARDTVVLEVVELVDGETRDACEIIKNVDEGYYFVPYLLHFSCWEEGPQDVMRDARRDVPQAVPKGKRKVPPYCKECDLFLEEGEYVVACTHGELKDVGGSMTFVRNAPPDFYCKGCVVNLVEQFEDHFSDWAELCLPSMSEERGETT